MSVILSEAGTQHGGGLCDERTIGVGGCCQAGEPVCLHCTHRYILQLHRSVPEAYYMQIRAALMQDLLGLIRDLGKRTWRLQLSRPAMPLQSAFGYICSVAIKCHTTSNVDRNT